MRDNGVDRDKQAYPPSRPVSLSVSMSSSVCLHLSLRFPSVAVFVYLSLYVCLCLRDNGMYGLDRGRATEMR